MTSFVFARNVYPNTAQKLGMAYTDDDCIKALQEAADILDHSPSRTEYRELGLKPDSSTISNHFGGSWNKAKEAAGQRVLRNVTEEDCIEALQEAADQLGHSPTQNEYDELGIKPTRSTIENHLGWNAAKEVLGLEILGERPAALSVNDNYFAEIDTPEKAYWLGFLYADGWVRSNGKRLGLRLQRRDKRHVEAFAEAIGSEYAIRDVDTDGHPDYPGDSKQTATSITSRKMASDLESHGCIAKKTDKDTMPTLTNEMKPHFVRGIFDGDGSIHVVVRADTRNTQGQWKIRSASKYRLETVLEWVHAHAGVRGGNVYDYETDTTPKIVIGGTDDITSLRDWLYPNGEDTQPALMRKTEKMYNVGESL